MAPTLLALARTLGGALPLPRWGGGRAGSVRVSLPMPPQPPAPAVWTGGNGLDGAERLVTAASERPLPEPPAAEDRPSRRRRVLVAAAVTAVVLLSGIAGATAALLRSRTQASVTSDTPGQTAYRQIPVAATASSPASGEVRLRFSGGGPDAVGYLVYRLGPDGRPPGGGDGELLDTGPLPGPTYEITGAEADVRHCFKVTALLLGGPASPSQARAAPEPACVTADGGAGIEAGRQ
jgi:hypothetical protein